jgi:nicotinamide-nucleotide amidase
MAELGIPLYWASQVGDNRARLEHAFKTGLSRSRIVISSGGLGPTDDDLTREAVASITGRPPRVDPHLETVLRARFSAMNREMPAKNIKQAWVIDGCEPLPNPNGTAPGWWVEVDDRVVIAMPGPPSEMMPMWHASVRPRLSELFGRGFSATTLKTFGPGESAIEQRLGSLVSLANPSVATYAKRDGVHVRVAASASDGPAAQRLLMPVLDEVVEILGPDVYGREDETLGSVVVGGLIDSEQRVATAESVTGGLISSLLTDVTGSSRVLAGSLVPYSAEAKRALGLPPDLLRRDAIVSADMAVALAELARMTFAADWGIGSTGAAGPEGHGTQQAGTAFIAVLGKEGPAVRRVTRSGSRETVKLHVALCALDLLRRVLIGDVRPDHSGH